MSLLTTDQNLAQTDTVWLSKQFIYQNCSVLRLQQNEQTKPLSTLMFYSTNPQTNLRRRRVLSEEWDYRVWVQSNHVWVTNYRLKCNRLSATKSRQIACSSFSSLHTLWCVFCTFWLFAQQQQLFLLRMEAKFYLICFLGNNLNRWFRYQPDDTYALNL
jgi:hypothetical protein